MRIDDLIRCYVRKPFLKTPTELEGVQSSNGKIKIVDNCLIHYHTIICMYKRYYTRVMYYLNKDKYSVQTTKLQKKIKRELSRLSPTYQDPRTHKQYDILYFLHTEKDLMDEFENEY